MEEDAGKLVHDDWEDVSLVDFNRSGVPLIEIVSEPDMRSAEEVIAYLEKLRLIIQYLGASDCKLTGRFNESRCKPFGKRSRKRQNSEPELRRRILTHSVLSQRAIEAETASVR